MSENLKGKYAVITVVSSFRQRYVVPTDVLAEMEGSNAEESDVSTLIDQAENLVSLESIKEFSQHWLGEKIVDSQVVDEARILEIFNADNKYLDDWSDEKKLSFVRDWKEKTKKDEDTES